MRECMPNFSWYIHHYAQLGFWFAFLISFSPWFLFMEIELRTFSDFYLVCLQSGGQLSAM